MASELVCPKHGVPTRLTCASCDKPICIRCQVRTEVGLKCSECAALPATAVRRRRAGGMLGMGAGAVALAAVGILAAAVLIPRGGQSIPTAAAPAGSWRPAPDLAAVRGATNAVALSDGRVLVAGGGVGSIPIAAAEIFNPVTATWMHAGDLHQARRGHGSVLLKDGRVLVSGGLAGSHVLASTEVFDPARDAWDTVAPMAHPRFAHVLVALADGRVLAAGGAGDGAQPMASAEVYDPATAQWSPAGDLMTARAGAAAVRLGDGRVLVAGGNSALASGSASLDSAELFDPAVGVFTRASAMHAGRADATLTLLADGRALAAGGASAESSTASAEVFDTARGAWIQVRPMLGSRRLAAAILIPGGRVLVAGGEAVQGGTRTSLKSAELFDPRIGRWLPAVAMSCPRSGLALALLRSGSVLAAAGDAAFPGQPPKAQSCSELFSP